MLYLNYINKYISKNYIVLVIIAIIVIFHDPLGNIIYGNTPSHIKSLSENSAEGYFIDREIIYPQEYFAVTGRMWVLAGLCVLLFLLLGPSRSCNLVLKTIGFSFLALVFFITFLEPKQFLVLSIPIFTAYYWTAHLYKNQSLFRTLQVFVLLLVCEVVLIFQFISLTHILNSNTFLIFAFFVLLTSFLVIKPEKGYLRNIFINLNSLGSEFYILIHANRWINVFTFSVLVSIFWRFLLILYVPANNTDGMQYHLTRIAHWMQNGSMAVYDTNNLREVVFPFNAAILKMWTMIASKQDYLCGFVQFGCYLLCGALIFQISKEILNYTRQTSFWTTLLALSMAQPVLQSTSTGNDLVLAYFILSSVYFSIIGFQKQSRSELGFAALALGLAIGTKMSALFFAIPYFLVLSVCVLLKKLSFSIVFRYSIYVVVSFFFLGSYSYIQNKIVFGNISGTQVFIDYHRVAHPTFQTFLSSLGKNVYCIIVNHSGWNLFSLQLGNVYLIIVGHIGEFIFNLFNIETNIPGSYTANYSLNVFPKGLGAEFLFESGARRLRAAEGYSHYGLCGAVIFLFCVRFLFKAFKKTTNRALDQFIIGLSFVFLGYLFFLSYFKVWDRYLGRLMMPMFLMGSWALGYIINLNKKPFILLVKILTVYSIITLIPLTFMNEKKPLKYYFKVNNKNKFRLEEQNYDRIGLRYIRRSRPESLIRNYYKLVPEGAHVGTLISHWEWEYPFFGNGLTRHIEAVTQDNIKTTHFDYLLISKNLKDRHHELMKVVDKNYVAISILGMTRVSRTMYLYKRKSSKPNTV